MEPTEAVKLHKENVKKIAADRVENAKRLDAINKKLAALRNSDAYKRSDPFQRKVFERMVADEMPQPDVKTALNMKLTSRGQGRSIASWQFMSKHENILAAARAAIVHKSRQEPLFI